MRIFSVSGDGDLVPHSGLAKVLAAGEGGRAKFEIEWGYYVDVQPNTETGGLDVTVVVPPGMHMDEDDMAVMVGVVAEDVRAMGLNIDVGDIKVTSEASNFPVQDDKEVVEEEEYVPSNSLMRALDEVQEEPAEAPPAASTPVPAPGEYGPAAQAPPEEAPSIPTPQRPAPQAPQRQRQDQR